VACWLACVKVGVCEIPPSVVAQRNLVGQLRVHSQKVRYAYKEGPLPLSFPIALTYLPACNCLLLPSAKANNRDHLSLFSLNSLSSSPSIFHPSFISLPHTSILAHLPFLCHQRSFPSIIPIHPSDRTLSSQSRRKHIQQDARRATRDHEQWKGTAAPAAQDGPRGSLLAQDMPFVSR
jgi:hypothetical protein